MCGELKAVKESDYHYNQSAIRGRVGQILHLILRVFFFALFLTIHLQRHLGFKKLFSGHTSEQAHSFFCLRESTADVNVKHRWGVCYGI